MVVLEESLCGVYTMNHCASATDSCAQGCTPDSSTMSKDCSASFNAAGKVHQDRSQGTALFEEKVKPFYAVWFNINFKKRIINTCIYKSVRTSKAHVTDRLRSLNGYEASLYQWIKMFYCHCRTVVSPTTKLWKRVVLTPKLIVPIISPKRQTRKQTNPNHQAESGPKSRQ